MELIELYDASFDEEGTIVNKYDYKNAPLEIASRLNLIPRDIADDCVAKMFGEILDQLDTIEKIAKTHRHKTFGDGYSEKPAW